MARCCYAVQLRDEEGTVTYTFTTKKKADEFYESLKNYQPKTN